MLRVSTGGFERQPFGMIQRRQQTRTILCTALLLQQRRIMGRQEFVRMPFADALRCLQPLRYRKITGIGGCEQRQIAGLNRIRRRLTRHSGLRQCGIGCDLCQHGQQVVIIQCCSHTFSSA
ncbi:hypothetical protein D3C75_847550 [compost metagenome]